MSNKLQIFQNPEFGEIRTVMIDCEPWFVGKDVAVSLGYSNTNDALAKHVDDKDKIMGSQNATPPVTDSLGREQYPTWINESGVYSLIFGSKLESAKRFKHWVTSEVLPALRKNGTYTLAPQRGLTKDDYLRAASIIAGCRNERIPYVLSFLEQGGFNIPEVKKSVPKQHDPGSGQDTELIEVLNRYSVAELAEMLEIPKTSIYYYRIGKFKPTKKRRSIIMAALGQ